MCVYNHCNYIGGYKEEIEKGYCKEGYNLHGTSCRACNTKFGDTVCKKVTVLTIRKPMYICIGRNKHGCNFGFCYESFMIKSTVTSGRQSRRYT